MNKNMSLSVQHFWVYLYWIGVNIVESLIYMYRCCSLGPQHLCEYLYWIIVNSMELSAHE